MKPNLSFGRGISHIRAYIYLAPFRTGKEVTHHASLLARADLLFLFSRFRVCGTSHSINIGGPGLKLKFLTVMVDRMSRSMTSKVVMSGSRRISATV